MAVLDPTVTPTGTQSIRRGTSGPIVSGAVSQYVLGNTSGSLGFQVSAPTTGLTFSDTSIGTITAGTWYAIASIGDGIRVIVASTALPGAAQFTLTYALNADGTGGTSAVPLVVLINIPLPASGSGLAHKLLLGLP